MNSYYLSTSIIFALNFKEGCYVWIWLIISLEPRQEPLYESRDPSEPKVAKEYLALTTDFVFLKNSFLTVAWCDGLRKTGFSRFAVLLYSLIKACGDANVE